MYSRLPTDTPAQAEMFLATWDLYGESEHDAYHRAGVKLLGVGEDLFETSRDPTAWSQTMRAVVRFMICHGLDPEQISGTAKST